MRALNLLVTAIVVLSCPLSARPDEHGDSKDAGFFVPDAIKWQEGPKSLPTGATFAVLERPVEGRLLRHAVAAT